MEAIIFMPGLGTGLTDQSLCSFADRYVKAIDINEPNERKKVSIKIREESFGLDSSLKTQLAAVMKILIRKPNIFWTSLNVAIPMNRQVVLERPAWFTKLLCWGLYFYPGFEFTAFTGKIN